jgi:hypothetical protein
MELFQRRGLWLQHLTGGDADPEERGDDGPENFFLPFFNYFKK